jgi:ParB/RepB/Spo0J family partition protein
MTKRDAVGTPLIQVLEADLIRSLVSPPAADPIHQKSIPISALNNVSHAELQRPPYQQGLNTERMFQVSQMLRHHHLPIITSHSIGGGYELQFGRYIASHHYQNNTINIKLPVVSYDMDWQPNDDSQNSLLLLNSITNLMKHNVLSTLEQAKAFQFLNTYFKLNQTEMAHYCGCSRSQVSNIQRLLTLPEPLLNDLEAGLISSSHCRTLLTLKDNPSALSYYASLVKEQNISVHALNDLIREHQSSNILESTISQLRTEGLTLRLESTELGGQVVISYQNSNELHRILELLSD